MKTEILSFAKARGQLEGVYVSPEKLSPRAIVVLVPGSGPSTRDGISAKDYIEGVRPPFVVWSEILAEQGYAVFRYDKRVAAYRDADPICEGLADEYLDDLADAVTMLQGTGRLEGVPLVLLGHRLGAIAALVYATNNTLIHGVATVGAPIEDLAATVKRQFVGVVPETSYHVLVDTLNNILAGISDEQVLGVSANYWRDYARYALKDILQHRRPDLPVLLIYGDKDQRIPYAQVLELRTQVGQNPNLRWETVSSGDHFLMVQHPSGPGNDGRYNLAPLLEWLDDVVV